MRLRVGIFTFWRRRFRDLDDGLRGAHVVESGRIIAGIGFYSLLVGKPCPLEKGRALQSLWVGEQVRRKLCSVFANGSGILDTVDRDCSGETSVSRSDKVLWSFGALTQAVSHGSMDEGSDGLSMTRNRIYRGRSRSRNWEVRAVAVVRMRRARGLAASQLRLVLIALRGRAQSPPPPRSEAQRRRHDLLPAGLGCS